MTSAVESLTLYYGATPEVVRRTLAEGFQDDDYGPKGINEDEPYDPDSTRGVVLHENPAWWEGVRDLRELLAVTLLEQRVRRLDRWACRRDGVRTGMYLVPAGALNLYALCQAVPAARLITPQARTAYARRSAEDAALRQEIADLCGELGR
jgi:hypothetical protein